MSPIPISANPRATARGLLPYLAIFGVALTVRLIHLAGWAHTILATVLLGDARRFDEWARQIAGGDWWGSEVFYQAPFYPYLTGTVYLLFGETPAAIRTVQALLGALGCVLLAHAGRRFFSPAVGWIAGAALAFYGPAIFYDGLVQKASVACFFSSLLLVVLAEFRHGRRVAWLAAAGLVLGAFSLTRENALVLLPIVALWIVLESREGPRSRRWLGVAAFLGGAALLLVPVGLRNQTFGDRFLPTASNGGVNFYIGNHEGATGSYVPLRAGHGDPRWERSDARALAERAVGRELDPAEVSTYWTGQALEWIRASPGAWGRLLARKSLLVAHAYETTDFDALDAYRELSPLLDLLARFHFGLLLPFAIAGAWMTRRDWKTLWLLYAIPLSLAASLVLFFVLGRFRASLVPILLLFAAAGAVEIHRSWRRGERRSVAVALALAAAAGLVSNWPISHDPPPAALTYYSLGVELAAGARHEEALVQLERALSIAPRYAAAHLQSGHVRFRMLQPELAAEQYRRVLELNPDDPDAHAGLAILAAARGEREVAYAHNRAALAADVDHEDALINLAGLLVTEGRMAEATRFYARAVRLRPRDVELRTRVGTAWLLSGLANRALDEYRGALELEPGATLPRLGEAMALRELGRIRQAIRSFELVLVDTPASPGGPRLEAMRYLAVDYARCAEAGIRNPARAVELAETVVAAMGAGGSSRFEVLAAAYAAAGRFEQAAAAARQAASGEPEGEARTAILERAELYAAGRAVAESCEPGRETSADGLWEEGLRLESDGEIDLALDRFARSIDSGPYRETRRYYFGGRFVEARPLAEVEEYYRQRVAADPKPQTSYYFWGSALARHGKLDEATERLRQALEIDPAHELSYQMLGDIAIERENVEQGIAMYRQAVAIHPEMVTAHERLATIYELLGRTAESRYHSEKARTSDPQSPRRFLYWGRALVAAERYEAAIVELERALELDPNDVEARQLLEEARR